MKFTTKKAREEWLRSDDAWTDAGFCAPIKIRRLNIPGHNIVRVQALRRRSEWVLELHRQMLMDATYYANMNISAASLPMHSARSFSVSLSIWSSWIFTSPPRSSDQ